MKFSGLWNRKDRRTRLNLSDEMLSDQQEFKLIGYIKYKSQIIMKY
jgi:hypothetical protein